MISCTQNCRYILLEDKIVVFNSLIGGAFVLSSNALSMLTLNEKERKICSIHDEMPMEIVEIFGKNGMLQNETEDKNILNQKLSDYINAVDNGSLVTNIRLTLTKSCNCHCSYCFVEKDCHYSPLTISECTGFVDKVVQSSPHKHFTLRFFGGEPTLEFKTIKEVVRYIKQNYPNYVFDFLLNTNVQYCTDEMRKFLKDNGFQTIISLDSEKQYNDIQRISLINESYYDAAIEQIQHFVADKMYFVVSAVVTDSNVNGLRDFLVKMKEIGVKSVGINYAMMVDDSVIDLSKKTAEQFINAYKFGIENNIQVSGFWLLPIERLLQGAEIGYCGGLGREFDLRPDRKIYTCVGSQLYIGSIGDSFETLIGNNTYKSISKRVVTQIDDCKNCELEGVCSGNCAWDAYNKNKKLYSANRRVCDFQKFLTEGIIQYIFEKE